MSMKGRFGKLIENSRVRYPSIESTASINWGAENLCTVVKKVGFFSRNGDLRSLRLDVLFPFISSDFSLKQNIKTSAACTFEELAMVNLT